MKTYHYTILIEVCIECHLGSLFKECLPIPIEREEFVGSVEVPIPSRG